MSGTIQSPATLLTELPDNTIGQILPVHARNIVESSFGTTYSTVPPNLQQNPQLTGAVLGSSGGAAGSFSGTLPTGWYIFNQGNLVGYVAAIGVSSLGFPYVDVNFSGTTSTTGVNLYFDGGTSNGITTTPTTGYTGSAYFALSGGALTNISATVFSCDSRTSGNGFDSFLFRLTMTLTATLTAFTASGTTSGTTAFDQPNLAVGFSSGVVLGGAAAGATFRIGNPLFLLTSTATTYTAQAGDRGQVKKIEAATAFTVVIPANTFAAGAVLPYRWVGPGQPTITGASGVTVVSASNTFTPRAIGSLVYATQDVDVPNLWYLDGDLT